MFSSIRLLTAIIFVMSLVIGAVSSLYLKTIIIHDSLTPTLVKDAEKFSASIQDVGLDNELIVKQLESISTYGHFVKLNVYSSSNQEIYTYPKSSINLIEPEAYQEIYHKAYDTKTAQEMVIEDAKYYGDGDERLEGNVLRIIVPLLADDQSVQFMVELFYDIDYVYGTLMMYQILIMSSIIFMAAFLYSLLLVTSWKADKIIERQQEENIELKLAKQKAEKLSQEKSKFLANVSHELRTPLNAIIGFSDIIKDEVMGPVGNEQYKDYACDINNSGVHLLSLINDILDYSKAEAGKLEVEYIKMDLNKVVKSSFRLVLPRAKEAKINLVQDVPKEHVILEADPKRMKQVILNLLSNSVKFTPEGGEVKLTLRVIRDTYVKIEVHDTGIGIAAKNISQAMSTFGQVDSSLSRRYEGTGLGLPFSKKLVEMMGGIFDIKSEEGLGTTITLRFPLIKGQGRQEMEKDMGLLQAPLSSEEE